MTRPWPGISILLLAIACTQSPAPTTTVTPSKSIARLEITPSAVLLENIGRSKPITVKAFDAKGKEVTATISITSSNPSVSANNTSLTAKAFGWAINIESPSKAFRYQPLGPSWLERAANRLVGR